MTTIATVNELSGCLRIRFADAGVINISEARNGLRVTTSSPVLLAAYKTNGSVYDAFVALRETRDHDLARLRDVAEGADDLVQFVRMAGLNKD